MTTARQRAQERKNKAVVDNIVASEVLDALSEHRRVGEPNADMYVGYARLLERMDRLWREIKQPSGPHPWTTSRRHVRREALGIAGCAIQFVTDCCMEDAKP